MAGIVLQGYEVAWSAQCRREDLEHRDITDERRRVDDARRAVDEKVEQLKAVSHLSALIAGFAMISFVEIELPDRLNAWLLFSYAATSATVVGLELLAMLTCTVVLIVRGRDANRSGRARVRDRSQRRRGRGRGDTNADSRRDAVDLAATLTRTVYGSGRGRDDAATPPRVLRDDATRSRGSSARRRPF